MKTVDQVSRGVASFYDVAIRPSLEGWKAIAYGVAVGRIAASLPRLVDQYAPLLTPLGILKDGMIDIEGLAAEMRTQMDKSGGKLTIPILGDAFTFGSGDIDNLLSHIERA